MATDNPQRPHHFKSISYASPNAGPRLIVTGAVHGNETCGTRGIQRVLAEIDSGALGIARGRVTFVPVTNPLAYAKGERAGDRNLNRNLGPIDDPQDFEDHVANWLCPLLAQHEVLLDLHSTRARSRPFAMLGPRDNDGTLQPFKHSRQERAMARVLGVDRFVEGWLDSYEMGVKRRVARGTGSKLNSDPRYGIGTTEYMRSVGGYSMTLECGQHEDPQSPEVAYRAIRNTLAHLGLVDAPAPAPVEEYEALRLADVIDRDHEGDSFAREWSSFDRLAKGDLIGTRHDGTRLTAPEDGWIVFPDKGAKPGHEWYYLARAVPTI
jgi:predicted deacylase